jgi:hypothetical protein
LTDRTIKALRLGRHTRDWAHAAREAFDLGCHQPVIGLLPEVQAFVRELITSVQRVPDEQLPTWCDEDSLEVCRAARAALPTNPAALNKLSEQLGPHLMSTADATTRRHSTSDIDALQTFARHVITRLAERSRLAAQRPRPPDQHRPA